MRDVHVCKDPSGTVRPCFTGSYRFLTGVLDQNFWPDGIYLAPGDAAMAYDLEAIKAFGHNYIRLHQKVPSRSYACTHLRFLFTPWVTLWFSRWGCRSTRTAGTTTPTG